MSLDLTFAGNGLAISPDSSAVYTAAGRQVAHFYAAVPTGQLAYDGCVSDDPAAACTQVTPSNSSFGGATRLAVSPDNGSVYAASVGSDAIIHFFRAPGGQIVFGGCLSLTAGAQNCGPASGIDAPSGIAMSPDGANLYVSSAGSDAVAIFRKVGPGGQIAFQGCLGAGTGCTPLPGNPLDDAAGVAVSPDGRSVYVTAGGNADAISHFVRSPDGSLTFAGCLGSTAGTGCTVLPGVPLSGAVGVDVGPEGRSVYVVGLETDALATFGRAADGSLTYEGCVANSPSGTGCFDLPPTGPAGPIDGARIVKVSADGVGLYVNGALGNSIAQFFRSVDPARPPGGLLIPTRPSSSSPTTGTVGGSTLQCDGRRATIVATRRRTAGTTGDDVIVGRSARGVIETARAATTSSAEEAATTASRAAPGAIASSGRTAATASPAAREGTASPAAPAPTG